MALDIAYQLSRLEISYNHETSLESPNTYFKFRFDNRPIQKRKFDVNKCDGSDEELCSLSSLSSIVSSSTSFNEQSHIFDLSTDIIEQAERLIGKNEVDMLSVEHETSDSIKCIYGNRDILDISYLSTEKTYLFACSAQLIEHNLDPVEQSELILGNECHECNFQYKGRIENQFFSQWTPIVGKTIGPAPQFKKPLDAIEENEVMEYFR